MTDHTDDVIGLYKPPFRYDRTGQIIYDSAGHRVLDVRGWGRIGYMRGAEELQDGVGERLAAILDAHWTAESPGRSSVPAPSAGAPRVPEGAAGGKGRSKPFRQPRYDDVYMDGIDEWERAIAEEFDSNEARTGVPKENDDA